MKQRVWKKRLALFVCFIMTVTSLPAMAFAENTAAQEKIVTVDAEFQVAWSDRDDAEKKRPANDAEIFTVYADGKAMENQPDIHLQSSKVKEEQGVSIYSYIVKELPLYHTDDTEKINYTVAEKLPEGYRSFTLQALDAKDSEAASAFLDKLAGPEDQVTLVEEETGKLQGSKIFGNYLPEQPKDEETPPEASPAQKATSKAEIKAVPFDLKAGEVVSASEFNGEDSMTIAWLDQVLMEHAVKGTLRDKINLTYQIDNGEIQTVTCQYAEGSAGNAGTWTLQLSDAQKSQLGLETEAGPFTITDKDTGAGDETISVSGLPSKITTTTPADGDETEPPSESMVKWSLSVNAAPTGYYLKDTDEEATQRKSYQMIPHTDFNAVIVIRDGGTKGLKAEDILKKLTIQIVSSGVTKTVSLSELSKESGYEQVNCTLKADDTAGGYTLQITGLPWCDTDKVEKIYAIAYPEPTEEEKKTDYYDPTYDNAKAPNFGSNTTECHDGGSLILTLTGKTEYTATKIWLDDGTATRPDATWFLWRYSDKEGASYKTASPVQNDQGNYIFWTIDSKADSQKITTEGILSLANALPKYDTDGYPYVYFARETMEATEGSATYEKVFGEVGADGVVKSGTDKLPKDMDSRESSDQSIYNEGTLSNRITEAIPVTQKKSWEADAYQSKLEDVKVELTLYVKSKGGNFEAAKDEDGTIVKETLDGFKAESLTREVSKSMPRYDKLGQPLEYKWEETGIYEGDSPKNLLETDENGNKTFVLSHNRKADGSLLDDGEEHYESTVGKDGEIINRLVGKTSYYIQKRWAQLDEDGNVKKNADGSVVYGDKAPEGATVTVQMTRDGVRYEEPIKLNGSEGWDMLLENLGKFDPDGKKYIYVAQEVENSNGWNMDYAYNVEELKEKAVNNCRIDNYPPGVGKYIKVKKEWLDDGDVLHREPVTVEVWRKADKKYGEDKDVLLADQVILRESQNWWTYVDVAEYVVDGTLTRTKPEDATNSDLYTDGTYYIRELKVGKSDVYIDEKGSKKVSEEENHQPANGQKDYVNTDEHKFVVTYSEENGAFVVTNRRIGSVNVTVQKEWVDGGQSKEEREKLEAKVKLVCEEYPDAVTDVGGQGKVTIDGETTPILAADGLTPVSSQQSVGTTENSQETLYFYNLPKYDSKGSVIHYTVEESSKVVEEDQTALEAADYTSTVTDEEYTVGAQRAADQQNITFTNKRSGTKTVNFHKKWIDKYVYDRGKRPDIYLTLYKTDSGNATPTVVDEYVDRKWSQPPNSDHYFWTCSFGPLPKYDDQGKEIIYYAKEGMHVDRRALDYIPEQYEHNGTSYSTVVWNEADSRYDVKYTADDNTKNVLEAKDKSYVLKEDGTFINEIRKNITVKGKKVWKNVPDGFPAGELPQLTLMLNRIDSDGIKTEKISWIDQVDSGNFQFQFAFNWEGENTINGEKPQTQKKDGALPEYLPAYDDKGGLYTYELAETVSGDYTSAYEKLPAEVNDYIITNAFNTSNEEKSNIGTLKIQKDWKNVNANYPDVQFEVYRFYKLTKEQKYSQPEKVATETLASGKTTLEISDLLVTAPNRTPYLYYVKEIQVNGYDSPTAKIPDGQKEEEDEAYQNWPNTTGASDVFTLTADPVKATNLLSKVTTALINGAVPMAGNLKQALDDAATDTNTVTYTNTYSEKQQGITLTGQKAWTDYSDFYKIRPNELTLTVYRWADIQGTNNQISEQEILRVTGNSATLESGITNSSGDVSVTWTKNDDVWSYKIKTLDRYAPNGNPWKYKVVETAVEKYKQVAGSVTAKTVDSSTGNITMDPLKNTSLKSASVTKNWTGTDPHKLRPTSITVKLQVKIGSGNWQEAAEGLKTGSVLPTGLDVGEKEVTKDGGWTATYKDLPAYVGNDPCIYRIVETKVGDKDVASKNETGDSIIYEQAGRYEPEQTGLTTEAGAGTTDATKITNDLIDTEVVSLKVTKAWEDSENRYNTRPESIEIKLQRTTTPAEESGWEDLKQVDGKTNVVKTITDPNWEVTYGELPKYAEDGKTPYHYRAVETTGNGAYQVAYTHSQEPADSSTITNTLTPTMIIHAEKKWKKAQGTSATLELQYKDDKGQWKSFDPKATVELDGTEDAKGEYKSWNAQWTGVPAYMSDGTTLRQYRVVENSVPSGYILSYGYDVQTGKTVEFEDNNDTKPPKTMAFEVTNTATEFTIEKRGTDGQTTGIFGEDFTPSSEIVLIIYKQGDMKKAPLATWSMGTDGAIITKLGDTTLNNNDGKIVGLPVGDYTIEETKTPQGYLTAKPYNFTLNADGTLSGSGEDGSISGDKLKLTINDDLLRGDVKLTKYLGKKDSGGTLLSGPVFDLYMKAEPQDVKIAQDLKVGENGTLSIQSQTDSEFIGGPDEGASLAIGLRAGEYYFVETAAAPDSVLDTETKTEFVIEEDRASSNTNQPTQKEVVVENKAFKAGVTFTKVDGDDPKKIAVTDATFTLTYAPDSVKASTSVSSQENGLITFDILKKGKYKLEEAKADGYGLNFCSTFEITEADQGKTLTLKDLQTDHNWVLENGRIDAENNQVLNSRLLGSIKIIKADEDSQNTTIDGAVFKLERKASDLSEAKSWTQEFVSGKAYDYDAAKGTFIEKGAASNGGVLQINGLDWGNYTLAETKAAGGYELNPAPTVEGIKINRDSVTKNLAISDGGKVLNKMIEVKLQKKGTNGETVLSGAEFEVTPEPGSAFAGTVEGNKITVTDSQPEALYGKLIAGNTYRLHEVKAPQGYEVAEDVTFKVEKDGTVSSISKGHVTTANGDKSVVVLTVRDEPIREHFIKRMTGDQEETGLAGAEITISGRFTDGTTEKTFTTGVETEDLEGILIAGETYTVIETEVPAGAMPFPEGINAYTYRFQVDEEGNMIPIAEDSSKAGSLFWNKNKEELILFNQPTALKLFKKGTDTAGSDQDNLLAGCSFEITGYFAADRYGYSTGTLAREGNHTLTVTTNGHDSLDNALKGRLIIGQTYTIREIDPPSGYTLGGSVEVKVAGTKQLDNGEMRLVVEIPEGQEDKEYQISYDEEGNPVITQRDDPVSLELQKANLKGKDLAGAKFRLSGVFGLDQKESSIEFTVDDKGRFDLSKRINESSTVSNVTYIYKLEEIQPPIGYERLEKPIYFKLNNAEGQDGDWYAHLEILYGIGKTPRSYSQYLEVEKGDTGDRLTVKDPKVEVVAGEEVPGSSVRTGDNFNPVLSLLLMLMAVAVATGLLVKRRRG